MKFIRDQAGLSYPHPGNAVVLNTSLNRRGEPVVCTLEDALTMFYASDLN